MKRRKNRTIGICAGLVLCITAGIVWYWLTAHTKQPADTAEAERKALEETAAENIEEASEAAEIAGWAVDRSSGGSAEKEETVYVNADASGNVKNITVSSGTGYTAKRAGTYAGRSSNRTGGSRPGGYDKRRESFTAFYDYTGSAHRTWNRNGGKREDPGGNFIVSGGRSGLFCQKSKGTGTGAHDAWEHPSIL